MSYQYDVISLSCTPRSPLSRAKIAPYLVSTRQKCVCSDATTEKIFKSSILLRGDFYGTSSVIGTISLKKDGCNAYYYINVYKIYLAIRLAQKYIHTLLSRLRVVEQFQTHGHTKQADSGNTHSCTLRNVYQTNSYIIIYTHINY